MCHFSLNPARFNVHYSADEGFSYEGCGAMSTGM